MVKQAVDVDPAGPVSLLNTGGRFPALIICEHASNFIPLRYKNLGLSLEALAGHIAWDPGAGSVASFLSEALDAPYVRGEVSRLVYDCNRPPEAADAMPERSEIHAVPGNENLSQAERQERVENVYLPFRQCIENTIATDRQISAIITVHSFTPVYRNAAREVEIGILHDSDVRLADRMLENAAEHTSMIVRRNEPYGPQDGVMHTLKEYGVANDLLNVMIEVRNDLLTNTDQCLEISRMLKAWLEETLASFGIVKSGEVQA